MKVIAFDDDPTGCQTVHSCPLILDWSTGAVAAAIHDPAPVTFFLTNTRAVSPAAATAVTRDACRAFAAVRKPDEVYVIVSRSDSTLRGHFPLETDVIREQLGPFDAVFVIPFFAEGGRITVDGTHYVVTDGVRVAAHDTEFASDGVFGYSSSFMPAYIEEKTRGAVPASEVVRFSAIHQEPDLADRLRALEGYRYCVVDAETQEQLNGFIAVLSDVARSGKRFLFRSAAGLLTSLAAQGPQPVAGPDMHKLVPGGRPGLIVVGSHVAKTTRQLDALIAENGTVGIEVDVDNAAADRTGEYLTDITTQIDHAHHDGLTPVVYTSRTERTFTDHDERLRFGDTVSRFICSTVANAPRTTGFVIAKGGITSHNVLSIGLGMTVTTVAGQILPGCPVVITPATNTFSEIPVVIFPGNVGGDDSLATAYRILNASE